MSVANDVLQKSVLSKSVMDLTDESGANILVSVVMPCLNEARTVVACIEKARNGCKAFVDASSKANDGNSHGYEIIIADNGSDDCSQELASKAGARVISVKERGYGAAIIGGIAAARGTYVVMGDADMSYDFEEIPKFIAKLEEGYDLVVGNRFAGGIKPGAMPWHHRYIGNPVLSGVGRLLYRSECRDWHCGLRAFDREKILSLNLRCSGMEFASEMVLGAVNQKLRIAEAATILYPDGRGRSPHLRSFRDGWRHLKLILSLAVSCKAE